ncbi:ArnT family glycosyltransferase [Lichenicoccus roseus]|uniref:Glycosyltransferase RgtA/B/C/D-like domain-containing protein n=1 Tax=Lichenicoccus roseus TaxID=2683649 RepID=A0A5R9J4I3_9PROT|nr:glycosyltransferase family 39 protein [Lichenicoccus roseus]TLU71773.1 hypothetical protein FE263_15010 [Lichenicoccus roseus]
MRLLLSRDVAALSGLWLIVTACNLFKPYTIDDTAHLIIADWILHHPLHPMSGPLNWNGTVEPIHATNQPHLYFYILAFWEKLFGASEIALHGMQSLFSGGCIVLFHWIARRLAPSCAVWLTAMLALDPAFIVSQNLMVDVPLLSCWLGFFACLIRIVPAERQHRRYLLAASACSAAILVKYSSLVLIPILLMSLVLERRLRQAWCLAVPLAVLGAWSLFNLHDYGGIHLQTALHASVDSYDAAGPHDTSGQLLRTALWKLAKGARSWSIGVGALSCFGIFALAQACPRAANMIYALCLGGLLAFVLVVETGYLPTARSDDLLPAGFLLSGLLVLPCVLRPRRDPAMIYLQAWIVLTSLFYILTSPFIAARHVLLVLPPISLLVAVAGPIPGYAKSFGLSATVLVSAGLCLSDFRLADFYRSEAATVRAMLPAGAEIWTVGHWGWQYYATRNGIRELDLGAGQNETVARCATAVGISRDKVAGLLNNTTTRLPDICLRLRSRFPDASQPRPGEYLIVPLQVAHEWPTYLRLRPVRKILSRLSPADPLCTGRAARFYNYGNWRGPWSISTDCNQEIDIFQVLK